MSIASRSAISPSTHDILLASDMGLLVCEESRAGLDQGIFDVARNLWWKDRARVQRARNRFLPRLEHLVQLAARLSIGECVGVHEGLIHVASQEEGIWRADVFHDRIDYIERWQFLKWSGLQRLVRVNIHYRQLRLLPFGCASLILSKWP